MGKHNNHIVDCNHNINDDSGFLQGVLTGTVIAGTTPAWPRFEGDESLLWPIYLLTPASQPPSAQHRPSTEQYIANRAAMAVPNPENGPVGTWFAAASLALI